MQTIQAITGEQIWNLLPHKRNETFGGFEFEPLINMYYLSTIKKIYARRKK